MKADLQSVKKKLGGLLMLVFVSDSKQSLDVKEWVMVVECVCTDGSIVPPFVIFKAENFNSVDSGEHSGEHSWQLEI